MQGIVSQHGLTKQYEMKRNIILIATAVMVISQTGKVKAQEEFQPSGAPLAKIYSNFHSSFDGSSTAFQITRAYFGYQYHMSKQFTGKVLLDVGTPYVSINDSIKAAGSLNLTAYLK